MEMHQHEHVCVCVDILFIYRVFVKCLVSLPMFCPHLDMVWNVTAWHRPPSVLYVIFVCLLLFPHYLLSMWRRRAK